MSDKSLGSTWLKQKYQFSNIKLSHESYLGTRSKVEIFQDGTITETFQMNYALKVNNPISHFEFALKYDDVQLNFFQAVLKSIPVKDLILL